MSKGKKREGGILSQFKKEVGAEFQKAKSDISADLQDAKNDLKDNISEMKSDLLTAKSAMSDAFSRIFGTPVTEDSPELLLEIRNLSVKYRTDEALIHAINDVSIGLAKGETLGVLGETGAGKTTLALSIMGLLPDQIGEVDHGEIFFEGNDLLCLPDSAIRKIRGEKISMVFQDPMASLNPLWPIGRQIAEALMLHNNEGKTTNEMEAIVDDMLRLVGIPPERKKEYPHQFSGGMKQRVVIAIALACTPKMLIADEPTTALDVTIQAQVLSMMQDLKERLGTSILLITHDLGVIAEMCDNVAVMYAGEVIEYGSAEAIFEGSAHHPYTLGLFGSVPDIDARESRLRPIDGLMSDPSNLPEGCRFAPRCPVAKDFCHETNPSFHVNGRHMIRCHRLTEAWHEGGEN